jgi:carbonic anhydrase
MPNIINCSGATAPLNIDKNNIQGPCSLLCDYNYNYGNYTPNISNEENYISLNFSGTSDPVKYNHLNYNVTDIRIYHSSLHKYNGVHADAELLIIHGGNGKNLIVSIPITSGDKQDMGSVQINSLIEEVSQRIPTKGESMTYSGGNFSSDNFIPKGKGFFSYTGTLPYTPCNGSYSYIVFDLNNALNISSSNLSNFKKIITRTEVISTIGTNYLFYNKKGANSGNNKDEIYIDCQPVNEEGELLINESTGEASTIGSMPTVDVEQLKPFLYILLALGLAIGITKVANHVFKNMKKKQ